MSRRGGTSVAPAAIKLGASPRASGVSGLRSLIALRSDRTSVTRSVRTSVTVGWWLGGVALSVGAPLLPTQGSLMRSLLDGLRPPLTREPLRCPWAVGWGRLWACPRHRAAPLTHGCGDSAPAAAGHGWSRGGAVRPVVDSCGSGLW